MNETVKNVSVTDDTGCPEVIVEKPSPKTTRTALADFIRRFFTPYKCEGRQGVYIDKELHQKISVIVGIAGKRQLTVGNYICLLYTFGRGEGPPSKELQQNILGYGYTIRLL